MHAVLRKTLAAALCFVLFFTQAAFAHVAETSLWSERRKSGQIVRAVPMVRPSLPEIPLPPARALARSERVSPEKPSLAAALAPLSPAYLRKIAFPPDAVGPVTVIHLQDVHRNPEAQKNISAALRHLMDAGALDLVALEGAFGPLDLVPFRECPFPASRDRAADALLREQVIGGPIHSAFRAGGRAPAFVGIDDRELYSANVRAVREADQRRPAAERALGVRRASLQRRKTELYSEALAAFDGRVNLYRSEETGFGDYARSLTETASAYDLSVPASLADFQAAHRLENALNFERVEHERAQALARLAERPTLLRPLVAKAMAFRTGGLAARDFYSDFRAAAGEAGLDLARYPALSMYLRYVALADGIDAGRLIGDARRLEERCFDRLARTPAERALVEADRQAHFASRLVQLSLTADEWAAYAPRGGAFSAFEDFYRAAEARDRAMAANLMRHMEKRQARVAVVVAGGFHARGLASHLKARATIVSAAPTLTSATESGLSYLDVFTRDKTPLEQLFAGERLFLSEPTFPAHVPVEALARTGREAVAARVSLSAVRSWISRHLRRYVPWSLRSISRDGSRMEFFDGVRRSVTLSGSFPAMEGVSGLLPGLFSEKRIQSLRERGWSDRGIAALGGLEDLLFTTLGISLLGWGIHSLFGVALKDAFSIAALVSGIVFLVWHAWGVQRFRNGRLEGGLPTITDAIALSLLTFVLRAIAVNLIALDPESIPLHLAATLAAVFAHSFYNAVIAPALSTVTGMITDPEKDNDSRRSAARKEFRLLNRHPSWAGYQIQLTRSFVKDVDDHLQAGEILLHLLGRLQRSLLSFEGRRNKHTFEGPMGEYRMDRAGKGLYRVRNTNYRLYFVLDRDVKRLRLLAFKKKLETVKGTTDPKTDKAFIKSLRRAGNGDAELVSDRSDALRIAQSVFEPQYAEYQRQVTEVLDSVARERRGSVSAVLGAVLVDPLADSSHPRDRIRSVQDAVHLLSTIVPVRFGKSRYRLFELALSLPPVPMDHMPTNSELSADAATFLQAWEQEWKTIENRLQRLILKEFRRHDNPPDFAALGGLYAYMAGVSPHLSGLIYDCYSRWLSHAGPRAAGSYIAFSNAAHKVGIQPSYLFLPPVDQNNGSATGLLPFLWSWLIPILRSKGWTERQIAALGGFEELIFTALGLGVLGSLIHGLTGWPMIECYRIAADVTLVLFVISHGFGVYRFVDGRLERSDATGADVIAIFLLGYGLRLAAISLLSIDPDSWVSLVKATAVSGFLHALYNVWLAPKLKLAVGMAVVTPEEPDWQILETPDARELVGAGAPGTEGNGFLSAVTARVLGRARLGAVESAVRPRLDGTADAARRFLALSEDALLAEVREEMNRAVEGGELSLAEAEDLLVNVFGVEIGFDLEADIVLPVASRSLAEDAREAVRWVARLNEGHVVRAAVQSGEQDRFDALVRDAAEAAGVDADRIEIHPIDTPVVSVVAQARELDLEAADRLVGEMLRTRAGARLALVVRPGTRLIGVERLATLSHLGQGALILVNRALDYALFINEPNVAERVRRLAEALLHA